MDKKYRITRENRELLNRKKVYIMDNKNLKRLNLSKLNNKKSTIVSSKTALKDVTPINWSDEVLSGKKKVTVS